MGSAFPCALTRGSWSFCSVFAKGDGGGIKLLG